MCDRALVIYKGKIIAEETISDLTEKKVITLGIVKPAETAIEQCLTALQSLAPISDIEHYQEDGEGYTFTIDCKGGRDARNAISLKAQENNWRILELSATATSLEKVFGNLIKEEGDKNVTAQG